MRFISCRQIWHDAYRITGLSGNGWELMDPRHPRGDFNRRGSASMVHAKETKRSGPNDIQIMSCVEMGKAQNIIAKLPAVQKSWGMYAYTEPGEDRTENEKRKADLARVSQWLYREWWTRCGIPQNFVDHDYRKTTRLILAVDTTVEQIKLLHITGQPTTKSELAESLGIGKQHLDRDGWWRILNQMGQLLDAVDRKALGPLTELLR